MEVRLGTIKKPKFLPSYIISTIILLVVFTVIALFPFMGAYMDYEYNAQEWGSFISADRLIENYTYEGDNEKEVLSGEDISAIKNILITDYLSYGQRHRIYFNDGSVIDSSRTAVIDYCVLNDDLTKILSEHKLRLADEKYLKYFDTPEVNAVRTPDTRSEDEVLYFERSGDDLSYCFIKCYKFYADFDKGLFIPVELEICTYTNGDGDYTPTGVVLRFEPDNTEGYTLINTREGAGAGVSQAVGMVAGYAGPDNDEDYEWYSERIGLIIREEATPLVRISFVKANKTGLMITIAVIIFSAIAFAFIPATISYNVKKRRYEIFEYRRKMVDAMAHDLKTPMAAISAYSENLSNNIATEKKEYYAGKVQEKVAQMNKMVNDILEFSKSENQSAVINKADVDIGAVISKIISDNEHVITERSLKVNFDSNNVVVKTDEKIFEQAVSNLINNAVLYSKEGTAIDVTCDAKNITVTNISADKLEDIKSLKQAFAKGNLARGSKGTGLGLAIADNNLAMLGYELDIRSEGDKFIATVKM